MNMHQLVDVVIKDIRQSVKDLAHKLDSSVYPECKEPYKSEINEAIKLLDDAWTCLDAVICRDAWERRGEKS